MIPQGSDVYYHIHQKFDALTVNTMNKYKSFKITDTFDSKNFDMVSDGKTMMAHCGMLKRMVLGKKLIQEES